MPPNGGKLAKYSRNFETMTGIAINNGAEI